MNKKIFLEYLEMALNNYNGGSFFICNCVELYYSTKIYLGTGPYAFREYLNEVCPEFKAWIVEVGQKSYDEIGERVPFAFGSAWAYPYEEKLRILKDKINELKAEVRNEISK